MGEELEQTLQHSGRTALAPVWETVLSGDTGVRPPRDLTSAAGTAETQRTGPRADEDAGPLERSSTAGGADRRGRRPETSLGGSHAAKEA